jgi:hypothetical protein
LFAACAGARRWHPHREIPGHDLLDAAQVGDLGETPLQFSEGRIHYA